MFGGYGIFHQGKMFALVADSRLYFKVDDSTRQAFEVAGSARFRSMPYYEVPGDVMEDPGGFRRWALAAIAAGDAAFPRKRRGASS